MDNKKYLIAISMSIFLTLTGCSAEPEWMSIYSECKDKVNDGIAEMEQSSGSQAMGDMAKSMGLAACEMIKNTCEKDPEGLTCKAIIDSSKKK